MNKQFRHELVEAAPITNVDTPEGRYYIFTDGRSDDRFRSVTTILGERLDKSALENWKKRVGPEEVHKVSNIASSRGTAVHNLAEKYLLNDPDYNKGALPFPKATFRQIKSILDEHVDDILGIEIPLYSRLFKCAGRTDLVANFDGVPSIIDFKTSKRIKEEKDIESYFIQTTVYSMMFEKIYSIKIPQIVIIMAVDDESPQVFVKDRSNYVKRVMEVFHQ